MPDPGLQGSRPGTPALVVVGLCALIGATGCDTPRQEARAVSASADRTVETTEETRRPADREPPPTGELPERLVCQGNEPSWRLDIEGPEARLHRLGQESESLSGDLRTLDCLRPRQLVWRGATDAPGSRDLVAMLTEGECFDTMADPSEAGRFDFDARLSLPDGSVVVGCCRRPVD